MVTDGVGAHDNSCQATGRLHEGAAQSRAFRTSKTQRVEKEKGHSRVRAGTPCSSKVGQRARVGRGLGSPYLSFLESSTLPRILGPVLPVSPPSNN